MVATARCDICGRNLKAEERKEIAFTDRKSLDLCENDLNLIVYIIDKLVGREDLIGKLRKEMDRVVEQVAEQLSTE
jgi:hypothetical protein